MLATHRLKGTWLAKFHRNASCQQQLLGMEDAIDLPGQKTRNNRIDDVSRQQFASQADLLIALPARYGAPYRAQHEVQGAHDIEHRFCVDATGNIADLGNRCAVVAL